MATTVSKKDDTTYFGYSTDFNTFKLQTSGVEVNSTYYIYDTKEVKIFTGTEWVDM
jgi:hypothetical protein